MLQIGQGQSSTPSWEDPLEMLYACHGKVKRFTKEISALGAYLSEKGCDAVAQQSAAGIIRYFTQAAPLHHADEEQDFFPELLKYAPEQKIYVDELNHQHDQLEACWQEIRPILQSVVEGSVHWNAVLAERFVTGYAQHIEIEEPLFECGKMCIPADKLKILGAKMSARRRT